MTFSLGGLAAGLATAGGRGRRHAGSASTAASASGELLAFLFLVTLFISPVQMATDVLNELQNAIAGWRRVIGVLDTPADVADPGEAGRALPRGPDHGGVRPRDFAYPGGPPVLHDIDRHDPARARVAVVGETGSGKTTFAKLLTRLMDPDRRAGPARRRAD